jgi:hypothetical protein
LDSISHKFKEKLKDTPLKEGVLGFAKAKLKVREPQRPHSGTVQNAPPSGKDRGLKRGEGKPSKQVGTRVQLGERRVGLARELESPGSVPNEAEDLPKGGGRRAADPKVLNGGTGITTRAALLRGIEPVEVTPNQHFLMEKSPEQIPSLGREEGIAGRSPDHFGTPRKAGEISIDCQEGENPSMVRDM